MGWAARGHRWVAITGMSGSGRTTALHALEDNGWFCIDNLPMPLLAPLHQTMRDSGDARPVAIGLDIRGSGWLADYQRTVEELAARGVELMLVFLDCSDEILARRFGETRRKHPVLDAPSIPAAIAHERARMAEMRERAGVYIDTSDLNVHQLKSRIFQLFGDRTSGARGMQVLVQSFGFKHGPPRDADWIFDARGLKNPHFVEQLRPLSGSDGPVAAYVMEQGGSDFLGHLLTLLRYALPLHMQEGRAAVSIAIGCTGGRHRSVALAEALAACLRSEGWPRLAVVHRDRDRGGEGR